jgi:hypothetical protein
MDCWVLRRPPDDARRKIIGVVKAANWVAVRDFLRFQGVRAIGWSNAFPLAVSCWLPGCGAADPSLTSACSRRLPALYL